MYSTTARKLRAVVEYIEEHLDGSPTLEQMAATAHLSVYHFARRFKVATGLPPHQYVIMRRVERAKRLLQGGDLSLAEVAAAAFTSKLRCSAARPVPRRTSRDRAKRPCNHRGRTMAFAGATGTTKTPA